MNDKLGDIYSEMFKKTLNVDGEVVTESSKSGTVDGSKVKAGAGFGKVKSKIPSENKQKAPVKGLSSDDEDTKPKVLDLKDSDDKSAKTMLTFDDLYKKTITENEDEIVPSPEVESNDFDENTGDFEGGDEGMEDEDMEDEDMDETNEEIDVASELRMLADRLSEIADKFSVEEGEEDMNPEADIDNIGGEAVPVDAEAVPVDAEAALGSEPAMRESVQMEAVKSEPTPKPLKKTTLGPKMKQNPKNKIGKSGAGKASTPKMGKDFSGKPSNLAKSSFGPKMSQNPTGNGPSVKGGQAAFIA